MRAILFLFNLFLFVNCTAQNQNVMLLPYHQIPDYPEDYSSGSVVSRMIDGLGYRYYWATVGLRSEDLKYKPSELGKSTLETLSHIYELSCMILNVPKELPNIRPLENSEKSYEELRIGTLKNLKAASELFVGKDEAEIEKFKVTFQRGETQNEFPLWNMINGPIADAIYHTGQVVSYRRSSGNPIRSGVNVFLGKTKL